MTRRRGPSVRVRLALSYAGFLMIAGAVMLSVVWVFLLRYVPEDATVPAGEGPGLFSPGRNDLVRAFAPAAGWALLLLLVMGLVGGWLLAGRMLAPLQRITAVTRRAAAGSLSARIDLDGRQDEFRELADSFDAMLERIEAQVSEQQRFAANASHELRTPLAITKTLLEVAAADPHIDVDVLLTRLQAVNTRAIELTEALLVLSRADQRGFEREPVDLSLVAEEAVEELLPLAERDGVDLETGGEVALASGSASLLRQCATNLVHNGIVHNHVGGFVRVRTSVQGDRVALSVENSGDRISPSVAATLTEPFQRGTQRVHGDNAGVGLGLAIVRSVVLAHDGTLEVSAREDGGLRVVVALPRA